MMKELIFFIFDVFGFKMKFFLQNVSYYKWNIESYNNNNTHINLAMLKLT